MPFKRFLHSRAGQLLVCVFRCFNVAAICALGLWHGYLFLATHVPHCQAMKLTNATAPTVDWAAMPTPHSPAPNNH